MFRNARRYFQFQSYRKYKNTFNKSIFTVHRWAGLSAALFLLVVTLSGSLLLFQHDLKPVLHPERYRIQPPEGGRASLDRVYQTVRNAYPDAHGIVFRELPERPEETVIISFGDPHAAGEKGRYLSVNPYTGQVLHTSGADKDFEGNVFGWLLALHHGLQAGMIGELFVALTAISLFVCISTGLYVYRKNIVRVLLFRVPVRFKKGHSKYSSLHRVIGVWALLFNLLIATTGLWMLRHVFTPSFYERVGNAASNEIHDVPAINVSLDSLQARVQRVYPGFRSTLIFLPDAAENPIVFLGDLEGEFFLFKNLNTFVFDSQTGELLEGTLARDISPLRRIEGSILELHYGQYGGLPIKILYFLGALTAPALSITGFAVWLKRKQAMRRIRRRRSETVMARYESSIRT